jgi:hypothetical protein
MISKVVENVLIWNLENGNFLHEINDKNLENGQFRPEKNLENGILKPGKTWKTTPESPWQPWN